MTPDEWHRWMLYRKKNGPLNAMLRLDAAIARCAAPFMGKGVKPSDLMPWPEKADEEMTPELLMQTLGGRK
jgi:hypothetical protein